MKTHRHVLVFTMFLGMAPSLVAHSDEINSETNAEKAARIEKDSIKLPLYAMTLEVLNTGADIAGMDAGALKAAREMTRHDTFVTVGQSRVHITKIDDIVTFSFVERVPDTEETGRYAWSRDRVEQLVNWVNGLSTDGIVFAKSDVDTREVAVPSSETCRLLVPIDETRHINEACSRFDLGRSGSERKPDSGTPFLVSLMASYGSRGLLYRFELKQALKMRLARVEEEIEKAEDTTGWIKYDKGSYELVPGHFLTANMYATDSSLAPGGHAEVYVNAYSDRVDRVRVELQYEDGTALDSCDLGNMAQAGIARGGLTKPNGRYIYRFKSIKIPLPTSFKPGKIKIVANAVDADGKLLINDETIGTFELKQVAQK